jgi:hypothetical protein
MSQVLIQQYLNQLQDLRKVSGTHRESVVREAFKDLLKGWARSHDLVFIPEYEIETRAKDRRYVDGALLYELRMPFCYRPLPGTTSATGSRRRYGEVMTAADVHKWLLARAGGGKAARPRARKLLK